MYLLKVFHLVDLFVQFLQRVLYFCLSPVYGHRKKFNHAFWKFLNLQVLDRLYYDSLFCVNDVVRLSFLLNNLLEPMLVLYLRVPDG
jgi:hypothetical protein